MMSGCFDNVLSMFYEMFVTITNFFLTILYYLYKYDCIRIFICSLEKIACNKYPVFLLLLLRT